jgi:O-acetyl-ADP-ribose deacetylase (regulator of RNase III)
MVLLAKEDAMIQITEGNILKADADALVNTVNCVGYMGKGIALQFKQAFPENFKAYQRACNRRQVKPGRMFIFETGNMFSPKYIINFPTKRHWRGKSRLEDINAGLVALIEDVKRLGICSIAVPPLGCGLGGLHWNVVRPMIEKAFLELPQVRVLLFAPAGTPDAKTMPIHTVTPKMTVARALLIKLMQQYSSLAYRLTLLEIQKLAYFLQEAGEPLRLRYEAGHYGPYASNLNKVLEVLEGHFIHGYGDSQKPDAEIELETTAGGAADRFLIEKRESNERLEKVASLIDGFETPYGMELLASVHWLAVHSEPAATDPDDAIYQMQQWSPRKNKLFRPDHIRTAFNRLMEQSWL